MKITQLFEDDQLVKKIQDKLPKLFQIAEIESSRGGKTGMEVGTLRERIIIALLIYKFGYQNVTTELPITEPEADVKVFNKPISIKTVTSPSLRGIKLIWTVDAEKAKEFRKNYTPRCDMILVRINWNSMGAFHYFPLTAQKQVLKKKGLKNYIKLPKAGTNPRGVEITTEALRTLAANKHSFKIDIQWYKKEIEFNAFKRWVELWGKS